jgi:hypothetical protein
VASDPQRREMAEVLAGDDIGRQNSRSYSRDGLSRQQ